MSVEHIPGQISADNIEEMENIHSQEGVHELDKK